MEKIDGLIIDDEDIEDANFYISVKGRDLYMHVIKIFKDKFKNENSFNYKEISSFIRYDKSLRDKLYSYLSYAEEYLKAILLENFDINKNYTSTKLYKQDFIKRTNKQEISNLYKYFTSKTVTFGDLVHCFKTKKINEEVNLDIDSLEKLVDFRNSIMHHKLLLLKNSYEWANVENEIENIKIIINSLNNILSPDYKAKFVPSINNLIKDRYFTRINLRVLKNGESKKVCSRIYDEERSTTL